ncbi:uncharacterized protein [Venturia canescens]|uniref:uncharacterized protein n=1 Tax=Venturia canescens TaxID=32260 RepID=UPI001C9C57FB|nr:uncharacterized protein LOC122408281 [Venturia canescens]
MRRLPRKYSFEVQFPSEFRLIIAWTGVKKGAKMSSEPLFVLSTFLVLLCSAQRSLNRTDLECTGRAHWNVLLTAYYPDYESDDESDYLDARGKELCTLQDFIDARTNFVTVGMDLLPEIPYGTELCSPELNAHFGMRIPMQVRDHGPNLRGKGFSRLDICVRSEGDSYDIAVNREISVYL